MERLKSLLSLTFKLSTVASAVLLFHCVCSAQKKPLSFDAYVKWPEIISEQLSNDGKFIAYIAGPTEGIKDLIVRSTEDTWQISIAKAYNAKFTANSKYLFFLGENDSLGQVDLIKKKLTYISRCNSYELSNDNGNPCLAYRRSLDEKALFVYMLNNGLIKRYENVQKFIFSEDGGVLLMEQSLDEPTRQLLWRNISRNTELVIFKGGETNNYTFNKNLTALAFCNEVGRENKQSPSIYLYTQKSNAVRKLLDGAVVEKKQRTIAANRMFFGEATNKLYFYTQDFKASPQKENLIKSDVKILDYKTEGLQSESYKHKPRISNIDLVSNNWIEIGKSNDYVFLGLSADEQYALFSSDVILDDREAWRQSSYPNINLANTFNGDRTTIIKRGRISAPKFSPGGFFVFWFDKSEDSWLTLNTHSHKIFNISKSIPEASHNFNGRNEESTTPTGQPYWSNNDTEIIIPGRSSIWKVAPDGTSKPQEVINNYPDTENLSFRFFARTRDSLYFSAYSDLKKTQNIFAIDIDLKSKFRLISVLPNSFWANFNHAPALRGLAVEAATLQKSKDANVWVTRKIVNNQYPNLVVTKDFRKFTSMTHYEPQEEFNWYTCELIDYKVSNRQANQCLLYKPEDFDSTKKYPVIFYYYERNSDALNFYIHPIPSNGDLNIPWYTSNGYIVCVPDIKYSIGKPGQSALESVVGAAKYLADKPWISDKHFGLQGHSFGGYETNYIVAHTNMFAAAASAAGISNLTSGYTDFGQGRLQWAFETGQIRLGASFGDNPELYIQNSPAFRTKNVTTPLLVMHNKEDVFVPWMQGYGWFLNLKRLGKKAWFISYDGEYHSLTKKENQLDYTIRLSQFFDHYLKGQPAPAWMTGKGNGFDLNPGMTP